MKAVITILSVVVLTSCNIFKKTTKKEYAEDYYNAKYDSSTVVKITRTKGEVKFNWDSTLVKLFPLPANTDTSTTVIVAENDDQKVEVEINPVTKKGKIVAVRKPAKITVDKEEIEIQKINTKEVTTKNTTGKEKYKNKESVSKVNSTIRNLILLIFAAAACYIFVLWYTKKNKLNER